MICKFVGNSRQARASAQVHDRCFAFAFVFGEGDAVGAAVGVGAAGVAAGWVTAAGAAAAGAGAGADFAPWAYPADEYAVASIATHAIAAPNRLMVASPFD